MLSPYGYGTLPAEPTAWFQVLDASAEYADFSYDASWALAGGDTITGLSIAVMPAGTGEIMLSRLALGPNAAGLNALVTVWITGGVPGRVYIYRLNISTALTRVYTVLIGQVADPVLAACPLPPPQFPGFGTAQNWP